MLLPITKTDFYSSLWCSWPFQGWKWGISQPRFSKWPNVHKVPAIIFCFHNFQIEAGRWCTLLAADLKDAEAATSILAANSPRVSRSDTFSLSESVINIAGSCLLRSAVHRSLNHFQCGVKGEGPTSVQQVPALFLSVANKDNPDFFCAELS